MWLDHRGLGRDRVAGRLQTAHLKGGEPLQNHLLQLDVAAEGNPVGLDDGRVDDLELALNGVVADIPTRVGEFAVAGLSTTPLMTIADMSTINVEVTDPAFGVIRRTLTADEAKKLTGQSAVWDLQGTSPDGFVRTYMTGRVTILADSSRDHAVFTVVPGVLTGHGVPPTDTTGLQDGSIYLDLDTGTVYQLS